MPFQASSLSSPQESQCLSHAKAMEDDILGELKFVLERILEKDDRHGWRTCMEEATDPRWRKTKLASSMKVSL
jgi:hypothetical protein